MRAGLAQVADLGLDDPDDDEESPEDEAYEEGNDAIGDEEWDDAVARLRPRHRPERQAAGRRAVLEGVRPRAGRQPRRGPLHHRPAAREGAEEPLARRRQGPGDGDPAGSGARPAVDAGSDEETKLIALNSLMHSDAEQAVPMLERFLAGNASVKLKKKALFVLSQSGSPRARQVVTEIAKGGAQPPAAAGGPQVPRPVRRGAEPPGAGRDLRVDVGPGGEEAGAAQLHAVRATRRASSPPPAARRTPRCATRR